LHTEEEDDEMHPKLPSERRGKVCSSGAMVRWVVAVGVSPSFPFVEVKKRWRGETWVRRLSK
jgi:hypothetical protein